MAIIDDKNKIIKNDYSNLCINETVKLLAHNSESIRNDMLDKLVKTADNIFELSEIDVSIL